MQANNQTKVQYIGLLLLLLLTTQCTTTQKASKKNENIQTLNPLSTKVLEVKKEAMFCYKGDVHASVGLNVAYEISDVKIVKLQKQDLEFANKEAVKQHMSGGDKATKTFTFQAISEGETNVIITEIFRGEISKKYEFKIIVK